MYLDNLTNQAISMYVSLELVAKCIVLHMYQFSNVVLKTHAQKDADSNLRLMKRSIFT